MDKLKGMLGGQLPPELQEAFPDGLPDVSELQKTVQGMSQEELTQQATSALSKVDSAKLSEFGQMMSKYSAESGKPNPPGVAEGDPAAIGSMLSGLMKGEGGMGAALQSLQDASGGGGFLDSVVDTVTGGKLDLVSVLKSPQVMAILTPIIAMIAKKAQGGA